MWEKGVENTSGYSGETFLGAWTDKLLEMLKEDPVMFVIKLGIFDLLFFIIPVLLKKYGGEGWRE